MSDEVEERRRRVAEAAARAAGAVHLRYRGERLTLEVKRDNPIDYATRADVESQAAARDAILGAFPGEAVIGEEGAGDRAEVERRAEAGCWLIDPLDGTMEYVHGSPVFSAIVSYVKGGETLAAAVYFPVLGELYSAGAGRGATLNEEPVRVSGQTELRSAIFSCAYRSSLPERARLFAAGLAKLLPHIEAFRLPGAPSVGACNVARGAFDLFAHTGVPTPEQRRGGLLPAQPWEAAAFVLLVQEAGGAVAAYNGGPPSVLGLNVYAASEALLRRFFAVLDEPGA